MKILINALSGNGDALMFSPSLRLLKEKIPDAQIDMLVMFRSVKEMYLHNPFLNKIYFIDFMKQSKFRSLIEVRSISKNEYDYSINVYPANRLEYNVVNAFLGAKKKIAHHYMHTDFFRAEFLNDVLIDETNNRHNVLQNLDLINSIVDVYDEDAPAMDLFISEEHSSKAKNWIDENITEGKKLIGFHAGSSVLKNHVNKRWDKEKYSELGKILIKNYNAEILLFGNESDLNNEIKRKIGSNVHFASTPDFMDSVARMKYCSLFISNDTAFLHSAAALQIPTVGIFGYTNYKELFPWKTKYSIVRQELSCSPCFYNSPKPAECKWKDADEFKCIRDIETEDVLDAVKSLI
ncbi:MAG TPA: glycosyltransferase family 9 protein [Ignavibacteria bacterium]|nr:glycosyltransferase family 9 protein [Bacteroidota bacterium]HRI84101.1 glycosyltransferase family 9 protein [Ignavibacteria bacterium]HRJ99843.1 glycosyltransferase family 9 protein [Ignavibacteria bacterium]